MEVKMHICEYDTDFDMKLVEQDDDTVTIYELNMVGLTIFKYKYKIKEKIKNPQS